MNQLAPMGEMKENYFHESMGPDKVVITRLSKKNQVGGTFYRWFGVSEVGKVVDHHEVIEEARTKIRKQSPKAVGSLRKERGPG